MKKESVFRILHGILPADTHGERTQVKEDGDRIRMSMPMRVRDDNILGMVMENA